jgi:hypothetical protein
MALIQRVGGRRAETIPYRYTRIARYAWHAPPWEYDTADGLKAYQPSKNPLRASETRAVFEEFGEARVRAEGILWLAAETDGDSWKSYARRGVRIDLSKLDHARLEVTGNGYLWHLGDIPAAALMTCPDCEWQDEGGLWRTGVCYNCKGDMEQGWQEAADEYENRMAGADCGNCQGTGSPICCRCGGTHVDLNP